MSRLIVSTLLAGLLCGSIARADAPMSETAARAWAVTDVILARHLDPPARQTMILVGVKLMARTARVAVPSDLARRVSSLSTPEQLAGLLGEVLAGPKVAAEATANPDGTAEVEPQATPEEAFLHGLLAIVPGGARLIPDKERKVEESMKANLYVGIQVQLGFAGEGEARRPSFITVLEGGPADHAGVLAGDLIEEVNGASTVRMPLKEVVDGLRGPEGTEVVLKLRRPSNGEVFSRTMTRGRLPRATVQGYSLLPDKRWRVRLDSPAPIGYLKLTDISGSTPQEVRTFAARLESEDLKALVLDLRATAPANFHETVLLADALLDGGVIGRVRTVEGEKTYQAEPDALFRDWPMVVLAAGNTNPVVAWLCAALEDNHRATIVGSPSIQGDATVSQMFPIADGGWSVEMQTGRLERGDGRPIATPPIQFARRVIRSTLEQLAQPLDVAKAVREQYNIAPADPNASARSGREFVTRQPPDARDLPRAIEILESALKSAAK